MTERSTQTRSDAREKVLATALELFTQAGYFNTSIRDVTRKSEVSTGSIYHYFKDKEGLALALYQTLVERMKAELNQIIQTNATSHDQCKAVIHLLFKITVEEPSVMSFMLNSKHKEFLPDEKPVCSSEPFEMMRDMVRNGMDSGEIHKSDVIVASSCLFGGAIRMITSALDGILDAPLEDYIDEVWTCSWRAVAVS